MESLLQATDSPQRSPRNSQDIVEEKATSDPKALEAGEAGPSTEAAAGANKPAFKGAREEEENLR